jgi:arylsulfatase A-like enzyme
VKSNSDVTKTLSSRTGTYGRIARVSCAFALAWSPFVAAPQARAKGQAEHVVVVVWDGMRPDFVRPQYCPTLYSLATNGVFFRRNHCAFISSTEVNGAALATGVHPGRSSIIANTEFRQDFSMLNSFATEALEYVLRGDRLTQGNYLRVPTVAETLQDAGIRTVIAGSKSVALFQDRSSRKQSPAEKESVTLFEGKTLPRALLESLVKVNEDKAWTTNVTHPNREQDTWTTRSLIRGLWKKGVPQYTLLWLSEPDKSQHENGVGSSNAISAIELSDKNLADVLKALEEKGVRDKTDILIVSDHGFSTIQRGPNVVDILKKHNFTATKKLENPEPGDVMVVPVGGSALFYVIDRVESVTRRLVEFLQTSDFAGVIFSRLPIEGTFPLEAVRYSDTNAAPDVVMALRWSPDRNEHGHPGMIVSVDGTKGKGTHASLSRFDMNNTLVASGPDFKKGHVSDVPSGNIDVAPTILWLLGVEPAVPLDGRVLHEALASSEGSVPAPVERRLDAKRDIGFMRWSQYLKFIEVGHAVYFDEGNGEAVFK